MFSEDPILLPEIVDQIVLVTVHPASEREDEELQRRRHSLRLLGRLDQHRPSLGRFFAPYAIRKAMKAHDDAQVRLEAALITLEIVAENAGVLLVVEGEGLGERPLSAGVPAQVKGSPEVVVDLPGIARLRARGPSGSIAEIRVEREKAANKLKTLTEIFGTADLETLDALQDKAIQLDERIAAAQVQIDTLLAEEPLEQIEVERATRAAMIAGIVADYPDWHDAAPDAEALRVEADTNKRIFLAALDAAEAARDAAQAALNAASQQRGMVQVRIEEAGQE